MIVELYYLNFKGKSFIVPEDVYDYKIYKMDGSYPTKYTDWEIDVKDNRNIVCKESGHYRIVGKRYVTGEKSLDKG